MTEETATSSLNEALIQLKAEKSSPESTLKAASFIIQNNHYDHFQEALNAISGFGEKFHQNVEWLYCMGFGLVTQHQPSASIPFLIRAIGFIPNNPILYTALTWAYLQIEDYGNAFITSSGGCHNCENKGTLPNLNVLSKILFQGHRVVEFAHGDQTFKFRLFTSNTQEIEASMHHLARKFTENDELEMLKNHLGKVDSIAEIGCLVGNHSVYFLKHLKPNKLKIIDASETSLAHTKINVDLNLSSPPSTEVEFVHSAIGNKTDKISFFGKEVPLNSLDSLLQESYDFIKIDVDGMEMEALEGISNYISGHRPKIMIEVLHELKAPFDSYLKEKGYRIIAQIDRSEYSNYLIGHN